MATWENKLWRMDLNNGLAGSFCPCFLLGRASERARYFPEPIPDDLSYFNSACTGMGTAVALQILCGPIPVAFLPIWLQRGEVRRKYDIDGSSGEDCMVSFFCPCCAISQMNLEGKKRVEKMQGAVEDKGYVAPPAMEAVPQTIQYPPKSHPAQHPCAKDA